MLGSSPISSFATGDDFTKLLNPFARPERLGAKITNDVSITELDLTDAENSVQITAENSVQITSSNKNGVD